MSYTRPRALFEGIVTIFLWSSSFVVVKLGLEYLSPAALAGFRYFGGFIILFPVLILGSRSSTPAFVRYDRSTWLRLFAMGLAQYPIGNVLLFWALRTLSPTVGAFSISLSPFLVLALEVIFLRESPTRMQILGLIIVTLGSGIFFAFRWQAEEWWALAALGLSLLCFASFSILAREFARTDRVDSLSLTVFPFGFGGGLVLLGVLIFEELPALDSISLAIVAWLTLANTALAYWLYNRTLRVLTAFEMNVLMSAIPLFTALMSWLWLADMMSPRQIFGMVITTGGIIIVQWQRLYRPILSV